MKAYLKFPVLLILLGMIIWVKLSLHYHQSLVILMENWRAAIYATTLNLGMIVAVFHCLKYKSMP